MVSGDWGVGVGKAVVNTGRDKPQPLLWRDGGRGDSGDGWMREGVTVDSLVFIDGSNSPWGQRGPIC
jgi:hypothetical protein